MNANEYSFAAENIALSQEARSQYPQVLFLPWSDVDPDEGPAVMANGLSAEGWQATSESEAGAISRTARNQSVRMPALISNRLRALQAMIRLIPRYDLVHISCHSARQIVREGLPALVLARFFGKRAVINFSSAETEQLLDQRRKSIMPFLRLADTIVVGSRYLQKAFSRVGLETRVIIQPRTLEDFEHRIRTTLQPKILVDCALEPDLNVGGAIRACKLVKQKYPRAELIVVGTGSEASNLAESVQRDSFYGVEFRSRLSRTETVELYHQCDLLLHTPMVDESPTSLVRAFAAGLPIVATDADGLLPMVRDGVSALVVAAGDHVALADAVIELIENQELTEKLSRQGATEAKKYTWARVRQDWVNLYTELWD
jgi:glycosyltransferase involved in cell wall biosynthesis